MKRLTWIATFVMALLPTVAAVACPMCKESIPNSDAERAASLPGGFNVSIYLMLVGLFSVIGLMSFVIAKGVKSTNARMSSTSERNSPRS
jgi:hypothetical protein